jgi:ribosomal protein S18 acetylase RimI-like enzyme
MVLNAIVYKMKAGNEMIGDIIVRRRDGGEFYLRAISVIPAYQSLGLGASAVEFLEAQHPDATR